MPEGYDATIGDRTLLAPLQQNAFPGDPWQKERMVPAATGGSWDHFLAFCMAGRAAISAEAHNSQLFSVVSANAWQRGVLYSG